MKSLRAKILLTNIRDGREIFEAIPRDSMQMLAARAIPSQAAGSQCVFFILMYPALYPPLGCIIDAADFPLESDRGIALLIYCSQREHAARTPRAAQNENFMEIDFPAQVKGD